MLGRFFGRKQKQSAPPPPSYGPTWGAPVTPFVDTYNVHFHGLDLATTVPLLAQSYMLLAVPGPNIVVAQQGAWTTAYVAPALMARVGFNKLAGAIAAEQGIWVIGYRVYAGVGLDVHYFHGDGHVAGLTMADDEIEVEPAAPARFADLADVHSLVPRPAARHPLDFHFDLLAALGIQDAALTWDDALARHHAGALGESTLLTAD